ncbi:hypothetical protein DICPUDRAFT_81964 [Dictyostelium purpureum]|uniref:Uncharacterized protein n=1 Tax=Dictyostelium purpureum TaxID=5786 RepID=F0ZV44_DICPU|nr:uncharacterized protein DICPUDRAFT_81964 [Dictyostelium purpureum]EGC32188.1 hypothetical protein DICPUDRAFT_81964 [Dictyostelium purpureum]|eukprot:XP_003291292.1 hypothetical protein DICPUDRAFT_81964 [Dictyostelium purpureum]
MNVHQDDLVLWNKIVLLQIMQTKIQMRRLNIEKKYFNLYRKVQINKYKDDPSIYQEEDDEVYDQDSIDAIDELFTMKIPKTSYVEDHQSPSDIESNEPGSQSQFEKNSLKPLQNQSKKSFFK